MMRRLPVLSVLAAAITVVACSPVEPRGESYFPLEVGAQWEYDVASDINHVLTHETYTVSVDRTIDAKEGDLVYVRRVEVPGTIGVEYWLRKDKEAIWRIASRIDADEQAKLDRNPRAVIKLPVAVGATWMAPSDPFVIAPRTDLGMGTVKMPKVLMTYTIEAIDDTVKVPAGEFKQCARAVGTGQMTLYLDAVQGFRDIPITNREWYCKGVGLVKLERSETLDSMYYSSGRITMELTELRWP